MSRLAQEYLQSKFTLPRKVGSVERDLSSGFLLAAAVEQLGCIPPEEFEKVLDSTNPDVVLENFRVLARGLKKLGISLSQKAVASIVSEQSGSAADLIMQIKRAREERESGQSAQAAESKFRESLKTLRPREFVRTDQKFDALDPNEKFYWDAKTIIDNGVFAEIDMRSLLGKYEEFRYKTEFKAKKEVELMEKSKIAQRGELHDLIASKRKEKQQANTLRDGDITKRWSRTLEIERQRDIRDLKFELTTEKISQLKADKSRRLYKMEQVTGVDVFEVNLKRSGIGGGDDDGQGLAVSYEDPDSFLNRVEETAKKNWPTKEEASDFMTQLKLRTKDKRVARYEKARRRRRMLLEQGRAAASLGLDGEEEEDSKRTLDKNDTLAKLGAEKEEKLAKMIELGKTSKATINSVAEEKIRVFSEQYRMMSDEKAEERREILEQILRDHDTRKEEKHQRNLAMMRGLVVDMVGYLFDCKAGKKQEQQEQAPALKPAVNDPEAFVGQLVNLALHKLNEYDKPVIALSDIASLDLWPATATLASNVGKWTSVTTTKVVTQEDEQLPTSEVPQKQELEGAEDVADVVVEPAAVASALEEVTAVRVPSFTEVARTVLETMIHRSFSTSSPSASNSGEPDFSMTADERAAFSADITSTFSAPKIVAIIGDGTFLPQATWERTAAWCGESFAFLWDTASALEVAAKLKPLMEGKTPTVTYPSLLSIFFASRAVDCPVALVAASLPPNALRACGDLVELAARVMSAQGTIEGGGELNLASLSFTETTFAILIGTSLWLRNFVLGMMIADGSSSLPTPSIALVARNFGCSITSPETVLFARVVDWFVRGGTRENVPDSDTILSEAIAGESGKGAALAKKKPPVKGKGGQEDSPSEISSLRSIVWVRNGDARKAFPVVQEAEGTGAVDINRRILDSFALASWQTSTFDILQQEEALASFAKASASGSDGQPLRPVTLLCVQQQQAVVVESVEGLADTEPSEEAKTDPSEQASESLKASLIDGMDYVAEISVSEILLALFVSESSSTIVEDADAPAFSLANILKVADSRRSRLSPSEKMWYLHLTGKHTVSMTDAHESYSQICESEAVEIELNSILILAMEQACLLFRQRVKAREVSLVGSLKSSDARWKEYCTQALQKLGVCAGDANQIRAILGDLVCQIGDVIDERHMKWLKLLDEFAVETERDLSSLKGSLVQISELVCSCAFQSLEAKREAALGVAKLLSDANYVEFPWSLPNSSAKGARMLLERHRDNVRASAAMLMNVCGSVGGEGGEEAWRDLTSVELPTSGSSLLAPLMMEIYCETLSAASSLLVAGFQGLQSCISSIQESAARMNEYVLRRHDYEHSILSDWSGKLRRPPSGTAKEAGEFSFLGQYHFGVSDDPTQDSIEILSGEGVCEARDMTLPSHLLCLLAEEISQYRDAAHYVDGANEEQQAESSEGGEDVALASQALTILVSAVKQVAKKESQIPRSWRSSARISLLVQNILAALPPGSSNLAAFFRVLITTLAFSSVSSVPPSEYILRLAKVLSTSSQESEGGLVFSASSRPGVALLTHKVSSDPKLAAGWTASTEPVTPLIAAIAHCCLDSSGLVVVQDVLLQLCVTPLRMSNRLFEKTLLLPSGGGPTSETNEQIIAALPSFLQDGIFKALHLASHVCFQPEVLTVETEAETVAADQVHASEEPASSSRLRALCGFVLSKSQLLWLFSALGRETTEAAPDSREDGPTSSVVKTASDSPALLSRPPLTLLHMC